MFPCGYSKMGPSVLAAERVKEVETLGSQGRRCFIFASPRASCPQGPGPGGCSCPCCHCCVSCVARSDWPQHCHGVGISRAPWQNSYGEGPSPRPINAQQTLEHSLLHRLLAAPWGGTPAQFPLLWSLNVGTGRLLVDKGLALGWLMHLSSASLTARGRWRLRTSRLAFPSKSL